MPRIIGWLALFFMVTGVTSLAFLDRGSETADPAREPSSLDKEPLDPGTEPGVLRITSEPITWTVGPRWDFRVVWTDRERMDRSTGGAPAYQGAIDDGVAHPLDFETLVCILEVDRGFKYWATDYRVLVLEGPLEGIEGWVDYESVNRQQPMVDVPARSCPAVGGSSG